MRLRSDERPARRERAVSVSLGADQSTYHQVLTLPRFLIPLLASVALAAPPNVVLVMTDDQGYGDLSVHGNPGLPTPNLDRLHSQSVRFTDFHVSPFCTPTRAALMTGRYAARTGAYRTSHGRTSIHPREVTMAQAFAANGYRTGMFGKWHLGHNYPARLNNINPRPAGPRKQIVTKCHRLQRGMRGVHPAGSVNLGHAGSGFLERGHGARPPSDRRQS